MARSQRWFPIAVGVVIVAGVWWYVDGVRSRRAVWQDVRALIASHVAPDAWDAWACTVPDYSGTDAIGKGGTYRAGTGRFLMTHYADGVHWGDDWTPSSSKVHRLLAPGEWVLVDTGGGPVAPADAPDLGDESIRPPVCWVLVSHAERLSVVAVHERRRLLHRWGVRR